MFKCSNENLLRATNWVSQSFDGKHSTAGYATVRFKVAPDDLNTLHISTVGRDRSSKTSVPLVEAAQEPADFLIPGAVLTNYTKTAPAGSNTTISFESGGEPDGGEVVETAGRISLKSGKFKARCVVLPSSKASLPPEEPTFSGVVNGDVLAKAIQLVAPAAAGEKTPIPVFTGVQITVKPEESVLVVTATDRYRLATMEIPYTPIGDNASEAAELLPVETSTDEGVGVREPEQGDVESVTNLKNPTGENSDGENGESFVVPVKAIELYTKFFSHTEDVFFGVGGEFGERNIFAISDGDRTATTRLLDGEYPNWPPIVNVVETTKNVEATVEVSTLLNAVKRVSSMNTFGSAVNFVFTEGEVELNTLSDDKLLTEDAINVDYYGSPFKAKYLPEYIIAILSKLSGEVVYSTSVPDLDNEELTAVDGEGEPASGEVAKNNTTEAVPTRKPGCFTPTDEKKQGKFVYILMPLS